MNCQSCGMPMMLDSDHGGSRADNVYCQFCTDVAGNLKTRQEVREGMINFYMESFGKAREDAEKEVDSRMSQMPAWMNQNPVASVSPQPVVNEVNPTTAEPLQSANPEPVVEQTVPQTVTEQLPSEPLNNSPVQPVPETVPVQEANNVPNQPVVENNQPNPTTPVEPVNTNPLPQNDPNITNGGN